ncbi:MAG: FHA domain-containing protein [Anaerolineales bacterium]|nr:FHA domain-containing protein [Anaerolineales bacterium]
MANDQLEIIAPNGEIKFFDLNPGRGITNIGRHPENDLVIDSEDVAPFHAVLDHRQKPFQLVVVSQETETSVEGQRVPPNVPHVLQTWDTIQLNGHSLVLIEGDGGLGSNRSAPRPEALPPATALAAAGAAAAVVGAAGTPAQVAPGAGGQVYPRLATPPAERRDDYVVTEITEREWAIDVEGVANTQLTVANGGDLVATFQVHVEGVDPAWVTIEPPSVNLFEGERATFTISITPPRLPTSRAGTYYLSLITASPDYANRSSAHTCTLLLNPFYEYSLSDLSPKQQNVTWNKQTARTALAIANRGNSDVVYRLDAEDDERGCHFEFQVPGDAGTLLGHAEVRLTPDTALAVPLRATPNKRRFFGVTKHHYLYTITATPLSGAQSPRARQGQLSAAPLVGPWFIILCLILLALLIAWIFRPDIIYFGSDTNLLRADTGAIQLTAGESVSLYWRANPWTRLTVESSLALDPDAGSVPGPVGNKTFTPIDDVNYTLRGENLLTSLFPTFFSDRQTITVKVQGVEPGLYFTGTVSSGAVDFDAQTNTLTIVQGGAIVLSWNVVRADELFLLTNGAAQSISPEQFTSSLTVAPEADTVYQLRALNHYTGVDGKISSPITVKVVAPSATPLPIPVIQRFDVQPQVITAGESIRLDWVVTGVTEVTILGVDGVYAPTGSIEVSPAEPGTYSYVLTASNGGEPKTLQQIVTVLPAPSATPEPLAPKIDFFTITPDEVVEGSAQAAAVTLAWAVSGATTDIQISGPDFGTVSNLNAQGSITVAVEKPTLFVLTAFNGEKLTSSATVQIDVLPPTPTPTPPPTSTPAPTPLPVPIVIFSAVGDTDHNEPADSVIAITGSDVPTNTRRYQVVAGTWVKFSWTATNAVKTIFDGADKAPVDSISVQINTGDTILFSAINAQNIQTDLFIQLITTPRPAPPAPFNVIGAYDAGAATVTLRWDYSNAAINSIDHFKVYRATLPDSTFTPYADNIAKTIPYQWADTAAGCDLAYYVVAVYTEIGGGIRETSPSTNSWYSPACPTPTPEP